MPLDPRLKDALNSPNPFNELRRLVQTMQAQRIHQGAIIDLFEQTRQQLHQQGRDREEEVLMELMDCLVGWCSPHMNLEPEKYP